MIISGGRRAESYIVIDNKKFQSRPANRKVVGNVVKEIVVLVEPSFPVALCILKSNIVEDSDKDVEEFVDDDKLVADELKEEQVVIDENYEYADKLAVVHPVQTPLSDKFDQIQEDNENNEKHQNEVAHENAKELGENEDNRYDNNVDKNENDKDNDEVDAESFDRRELRPAVNPSFLVRIHNVGHSHGF